MSHLFFPTNHFQEVLLIVLKLSSGIRTFDENMKSFLAPPIVHNIACHIVSNPLSPFPRPIAKQIPIKTKGFGCTHKLNPSHLNILYHNPQANEHVPNNLIFSLQHKF
jgi:hypothetical protein